MSDFIDDDAATIPDDEIEDISDIDDADSDADSDSDIDSDVDSDMDSDGNEKLAEIDYVESANDLIKHIVVTQPENRRMSNVMTAFELTEAISIRAEQIAKDGIVLTDVGEEDNECEMAKLEIDRGVCPLVLRRKAGEVRKNGELTEYYEFWSVNEMVKPAMYGGGIDVV